MLKTMLTNREKLLEVPPEVEQEYCAHCGKPLLYVEITMGSIKQRIFRPCFCAEHSQAPSSLQTQHQAHKRTECPMSLTTNAFSAIGVPDAYVYRKLEYSGYLERLKAHRSLLMHSIDDTSEAMAAKLVMYAMFSTISSRYVQAYKLLASDELYEQAYDVDMLSICGVGSEPKDADTLAKLYSLLTARISAKRLTVLTSRFDKEHLIKHYECAGVNAFTTIINEQMCYYDLRNTDEETQ